MVKRTLMALGLGVALLGGGVASTAYASSVIAAHPAAVHADLVAGDTGNTTPGAGPHRAGISPAPAAHSAR